MTRAQHQEAMSVLLPNPQSVLSQHQADARLLAEVSIIVPVGPGDFLWRRLLACLACFPIGSEIYFVGTESQPGDFEQFAEASGTKCSVHWSTAAVGRGSQMNAGVACSDRRFLWFLHADSLVQPDAVVALDEALQNSPEAIHYFDLSFISETLSLTTLNSWGVWFRSHCLGLPFGDQGLCMSRQILGELGLFNEVVSYGEDHLLIWAAHRRRIPVRPVGATIATSTRKYEAGGWFRTTVLHLWRTFAQAFPQWIQLVRSRLR